MAGCFFSDLTTYVDECCHLMHGFGFDTDRLKSGIYLLLVFRILDEFKDYIKDGNPMIGIVPFASTSKCRILLQNLEIILRNKGIN